MPSDRYDGYSTVKIPRRVADEIDNLRDDYGYRSRAEFVVDAIRRLLEKKREEGPPTDLRGVERKLAAQKPRSNTR